MRRGRVLLVEEGKALVVFDDIGIQKWAQVMNGVALSEGDIAVVLSEGDFADCIIIGTV